MGPNFYTCDAKFTVYYTGLHEVVFMYGDAATSFSGDDVVLGLDIDQFHTYRFESLDGVNYTISVDGDVFIDDLDEHSAEVSYLQLGGRGGGCEDPVLPLTINEWDMIRYGTISYGEQIVAANPPQGLIDAREQPCLDRFTVTFDQPNYVYVDEIAVSVTAGETPTVVQTLRLDNGAEDTVEIVLDRPLPMGATTQFTFDDGVAVSVVEYQYAPGDTDGDGDVDLADAARLQICLGQSPDCDVCEVFDFNADDVVNLTDYEVLFPLLTGP
jgi:hypothetical protein